MLLRLFIWLGFGRFASRVIGLGGCCRDIRRSRGGVAINPCRCWTVAGSMLMIFGSMNQRTPPVHGGVVSFERTSEPPTLEHDSVFRHRRSIGPPETCQRFGQVAGWKPVGPMIHLSARPKTFAPDVDGLWASPYLPSI